MSENLMDSIAPQLAPPVTRAPLGTGDEARTGAEPSVMGIPVSAMGITMTFADDDAE
jgi:hypothetical protein